MPPGLEALQRAMAANILDPSARIPLDWFALPTGADPAVRVGVYVGGYPARITEALKETFPAIANIVGASEFAELAERYLERLHEPPRNLNYIGRDLADHLTGDPLTGSLPFLPDLARLEWAVVRCFHAEAGTPFDLRQCVPWDAQRWECARIDFQAGTEIVHSDWPVLALRESRHQERESIDLDLGSENEPVLVYRVDFEVVTESVDQLEAQAFEHLRAWSSLGEVMANFARSGVDPERVTQLFARWVSLGLVRQCG
ncbi:MAG: putative DNA-binding domain-containing protein [Deltaproteobacteria bacterium]|nr:putative DNA-binding domain-containing protein [Deltaproteobacteria bacterium]MBW2725200.1 putative DNA-binding domain-containing protein [Deltaproteobacteria bacterium]